MGDGGLVAESVVYRRYAGHAVGEEAGEDGPYDVSGGEALGGGCEVGGGSGVRCVASP